MISSFRLIYEINKYIKQKLQQGFIIDYTEMQNIINMFRNKWQSLQPSFDYKEYMPKHKSKFDVNKFNKQNLQVKDDIEFLNELIGDIKTYNLIFTVYSYILQKYLRDAHRLETLSKLLSFRKSIIYNLTFSTDEEINEYIDKDKTTATIDINTGSVRSSYISQPIKLNLTDTGFAANITNIKVTDNRGDIETIPFAEPSNVFDCSTNSTWSFIVVSNYSSNISVDFDILTTEQMSFNNIKITSLSASPITIETFNKKVNISPSCTGYINLDNKITTNKIHIKMTKSIYDKIENNKYVYVFSISDISLFNEDVVKQSNLVLKKINLQSVDYIYFTANDSGTDIEYKLNFYDSNNNIVGSNILTKDTYIYTTDYLQTAGVTYSYIDNYNGNFNICVFSPSNPAQPFLQHEIYLYNCYKVSVIRNVSNTLIQLSYDAGTEGVSSIIFTPPEGYTFVDDILEIFAYDTILSKNQYTYTITPYNLSITFNTVINGTINVNVSCVASTNIKYIYQFKIYHNNKGNKEYTIKYTGKPFTLILKDATYEINKDTIVTINHKSPIKIISKQHLDDLNSIINLDVNDFMYVEEYAKVSKEDFMTSSQLYTNTYCVDENKNILISKACPTYAILDRVSGNSIENISNDHIKILSFVSTINSFDINATLKENSEIYDMLILIYGEI